MSSNELSSALAVGQSIRQRIAEGGKTKPTGTKKIWAPPNKEDFRRFTTVLCFDQAINNTGWCLIEGFADQINVVEAGHIRPPADLPFKSHALTLERLHYVGQEIEAVLRRFDQSSMWAIDQVIWESPNVQGMRLESSLMTAREVDRLTRSLRMRSASISNQTMKALLLPPEERSGNSKRYVRKAVEKLLDKHPVRPWNEHVCDAAALGLTYLHRG